MPERDEDERDSMLEHHKGGIAAAMIHLNDKGFKDAVKCLEELLESMRYYEQGL